MSERQDMAYRFAGFFMEHDMCRPFGGDVTKGKRSYDVLFARPRTLDGLLRVFGPTFIQVQCQGPVVPSGSYTAVYTSEADALAFLKAAFVDRDWGVADAVPRKERG
jgi:hypothetical protein